jgi:hypothetical protein
MKARFVIALLGTLALPVAAAQQSAGSPETEQGTIRTASYQLFALEGRGVNGALNVSQRVEGGSQFVVTLTGIEAGSHYLPVLFEGDCGPDRVRVAALPTVGSIANEPFSSISNVSLEFEEVAEGDYFLYIYGEDESGPPLACGEVGEGANR